MENIGDQMGGEDSGSGNQAGLKNLDKLAVKKEKVQVSKAKIEYLQKHFGFSKGKSYLLLKNWGNDLRALLRHLCGLSN